MYTQHIQRLLYVTLFALLLSHCEQLGNAVISKQITPDVIQGAQTRDAWYQYLPDRAPGFCLRTTRTLIWKDPVLHLGYWRGVDPKRPRRTYMEARDDTLIIYPGYIWDGMTIGTTTAADLPSTLLHDALYHALAAGAYFPRIFADLAFLRQRRFAGLPGTRLQYRAIRLFGWPSSLPHGAPTLRIIPISPASPTAYPLSHRAVDLRHL